MATVAELSARVTADTSGFDTKIASAETRFKKFGQTLESVGTSLSIGLTAPLLLVGKTIFDVGSSYEKSMNTFQSVTKATADQMARAAQVAQKLGADMSLPATSAADAAAAMTQLSKGGFDAEQAMMGARGALVLAAAASISEAQAAEITANALNMFKLSASESGHVTDLLAGASAAASGEITDMAMALSQAGSGAHALGVPLEDTVTAISLMAKAGIMGSDAGTSLKTMFASLTPKTKEAAAALKELGIDAFDAQGNFVGLETLIQQATPALAGMTKEMRETTAEAAFGSDGIRGFNLVIAAGSDAWNAMGEATNRAGIGIEIASAKSKGLAGAIDGLKSQLETAALEIYNNLAPSIETVIRKIADMVAGLGKLNPEVIKFGVTVAAVAGSAGPLALLAGQLIKLGPTGAIVAAVIAGAGAMAGAYVTNFAKMRDSVDSFFSHFGNRTAEGKSSSGAFAEAVAKLGIHVVAGMDLIMQAVNKMVVTWQTAMQAMIDIATFNVGRLATTWAEGKARLDKIDQDYLKRVEGRNMQLIAIQEGGMKGLADALASSNSKMGKDAATQLYTSYTGVAPISKIQTVVLQDMTTFGARLKQISGVVGLDSALEMKSKFIQGSSQSPFFIIHETQKALDWVATEGVRQIGVAGFSIGKKFKEQFESGLQGLNEILQGKFNFSISADTFKILLQSFPKVVKELDETSRRWHNLNTNIELYSVLILTAEGRTTDFVKRIDAARQSLLDADKAMRDRVTPSLTDLGGALQRVTIISDQFGDAIAKSVGTLVEQTIKANQAQKSVSDEAERTHDILVDRYNDLSRQLPQSWNIIIDGILNGSKKTGDALLKMSNSVKGWAADIVGLIDLMPGKFGDTARKILDTANTWILFGQKVIDIIKKISTSANDADEDLLDWAKKSSTASGEIAKSSEKDMGAVQKAFGIATTSIAAFATGLQVASATGSKALGALAGAAQGALSGFQQGGIWGAVIGGVSGLLGGIFGGGKSSAQKAAEEKAKRDAAMQTEQAITAITQGIMDGMEKGRQLLEGLGKFVEVPKQAVNKFFAQMSDLLIRFVDMSKGFRSEGLDASKALLDNLGGAFEFMISAIDLTQAIEDMKSVTDETIAALMSFIARVAASWDKVASEIETGIAKRGAKIATKLAESFAFIRQIPDTIKAILDTPLDISDDQISKPFELARRVVDKMGVLSEEFFGYSLNKTVKVSGQFAQIFESAKGIFDFFKVFSEYKPADDSIFDGITKDFDRMLSWLDGLIALGESGLAKSETLANVISRMAAALAAGLSGLNSLSQKTASSGSNLTASSNPLNLQARPTGGAAVTYQAYGASSRPNITVSANINVTAQDGTDAGRKIAIELMRLPQLAHQFGSR